jgi:hypothetical protein
LPDELLEVDVLVEVEVLVEVLVELDEEPPVPVAPVPPVPVVSLPQPWMAAKLPATMSVARMVVCFIFTSPCGCWRSNS